MPVEYARMVEFLRDVHSRPGGTGAVLNLIHGSKLRWSSDLSALTALVSDPRRKLDLARHSFDEARHSYLLLERMAALGFKPFRLPSHLDRLERLLVRSRARDVKQVYAEGASVGDAELMELVAAALILEEDALLKLQAHCEVLSHDPTTRAILCGMSADETRHVAYLGAWLDGFATRFSPRAVAAARERLTETFRAVDDAYCGALAEDFDRAAQAA